MMRLRAVVEYDPKVEACAAYCPELPGCASCGDIEREALKNLREAIALYLEPTPLKPSRTRKITSLTV